MNETLSQNEIRKILNSPSRLRGKHQIDLIQKLTESVSFFEKITAEHKSPEIHRECCSVMFLEEYEKNDAIITFGEQATKFYIILEGRVSVMVPIKKKIKLTIQEYKRYEDVCEKVSQESSSSSLESSNSLESIEMVQNKRLDRHKPVAVVNVKEILEKFKQEEIKSLLKKENTSSHINEEKIISRLFREKLMKEKREILNVIKESNKEFIEIEIDKMEEVDELSKGDSFGELALISDRPRAASVFAKEHVSVLVLRKNQFKEILGTISEKTVAWKVRILQNLPYFAYWSKISLSKLSYYFQVQEIVHKQQLFAQGQKVNGIYFVVDGEFVMTKKVESSELPIYVFQSDFENLSGKKIKLGKEIKEKKIVIKGKNESIGGYEIFHDIPLRQFSCYCNSSTAEVFYITKEHFLSKVQNLESIKTIINEENIRLEKRYNEIVKFEGSGYLKDIFRSSPISKSIKLIPDGPIEVPKIRVFQNLKTDSKSFVFDKSDNNLKLATSSSRSPFRKLTESEIYEAVNGRGGSVLCKVKPLQRFIQKRTPPKSFLMKFRSLTKSSRRAIV